MSPSFNLPCSDSVISRITFLNPCITLYVISACAALLLLLHIYQYTRILRAKRAPTTDVESGPVRTYSGHDIDVPLHTHTPTSPRTPTHHQPALFTSIACLACVQLALLILSIISPHLGAPVQVYVSIQLITTAASLIMELHARRVHVALSGRLVWWFAALSCVVLEYFAIMCVVRRDVVTWHKLALGLLVLATVQMVGVVGLVMVGFKRREEEEAADANLRQSLLTSEDRAQAQAYAAEQTTPRGGSATPRGGGTAKRKRSWLTLLIRVVRYIWPYSYWLQLRVMVCVICVLCVRALNLAVPVLYKQVTDHVAHVVQEEGKKSVTERYKEILMPSVLAYIAVILFQGGGGVTGLLSNVQAYVWIPVEQDAYRRISNDVFMHVMNLDLNFHMTRKTGEVTRMIDRGTASVESVLSAVIFSLGPQFLDVFNYLTYMTIALNPYVALLIFLTFVTYIIATIQIMQYRVTIRKLRNQKDNARSAIAVDALLNYETVKYFTNEPLEASNYAEAVGEYLEADWKNSSSLCLLNMVQGCIIFVGVAGGLLLVTWKVAQGKLGLGDLVLFLTMVWQCYAPLKFLGSYYRFLQSSTLDLENLFDLIGKQPDVQDKPRAPALKVTTGTITFNNVNFIYKDMPALSDVSFSIPGGSTVAIVGPTGAGKSTITRLLFRFYDPQGGSVCIDGQDLRDVKQRSVRQCISMVPQDTVLFNNTVKYNISYGDPSSSDKDVQQAADNAALGDTLRSRLPDGFATVVGERGLRLSGGEKQRVAFARAMLKRAPILVLDEATSSLDSVTEGMIQSALKGQMADRTTIIIAHRFSTIRDADKIIVLKEGHVAEVGNHDELIKQDGLYTQLWRRQEKMGSSDDLQSAG